MTWNKAPKEAEACKDFAERALKRIAELEELTTLQAATILRLEKDCDGRCEVAREEVRRLAAKLTEADALIEAQKREIEVLHGARDDAERWRRVYPLLVDVHPHLDKLIDYSSTAKEYPLNAIAHKLIAAIDAAREGSDEPPNRPT